MLDYANDLSVTQVFLLRPNLQIRSHTEILENTAATQEFMI